MSTLKNLFPNRLPDGMVSVPDRPEFRVLPTSIVPTDLSGQREFRVIKLARVYMPRSGHAAIAKAETDLEHFQAKWIPVRRFENATT